MHYSQIYLLNAVAEIIHTWDYLRRSPGSAKLRTGDWIKPQNYNPLAAELKNKVSYPGPQILNGLTHSQHAIKIQKNIASKVISLLRLFLVFLFISKDTEEQLSSYHLSEI